MIRRVGTILLTSMAMYAMPTTASAQSFGLWNPALTIHTVDAAALGTSGHGFLEYNLGDSFSYTAGAGIAALGGMLRVTYAHNYSQSVGGLGYARMLAAKDAGMLGTWGMGVDLTGAMDFRQSAAATRAARLSIPLSLRWGSPSRLSIAPYVAPYGEIGRERMYLFSCDQAFSCTNTPLGIFGTHAFGLASGVQLTAWRASFEIGLRDLPRREFGQTTYQASAGVRLRF